MEVDDDDPGLPLSRARSRPPVYVTDARGRGSAGSAWQRVGEDGAGGLEEGGGGRGGPLVVLAE